MPRKFRAAMFVQSISDLSADDRVLRIGRLRMEYITSLVHLGRHNLDVVLTGERRRHYLTDHPDIAPYEQMLARVVLNPDQVHRNRKDPRTAIFYKRMDEEHYLRAAIVLQLQAGELKHSVFSFRLAKNKEVEDGRRGGRVIWSKK